MSIEDRLNALAQATGGSPSFYVREAIMEHLDDLEDVYRAEKRLEDIPVGRSRTVPLEAVIKQYRRED